MPVSPSHHWEGFFVFTILSKTLMLQYWTFAVLWLCENVLVFPFYNEYALCVVSAVSSIGIQVCL